VIRSILWFFALLPLYVVGEGIIDLLLPQLAPPISRWLRGHRSPWLLAAIWVLALLAMIGGWRVGSSGMHTALAAALFILGGASAIAAMMTWFRVANELPSRQDARK
jgi:hypothetical protein